MSDHNYDLAKHLDEALAALGAETQAEDTRVAFEVARAAAEAAVARLDALAVRLVIEAVLGIWPNARAAVVARTSDDDAFMVAEVRGVDSRALLNSAEVGAQVDAINELVAEVCTPAALGPIDPEAEFGVEARIIDLTQPLDRDLISIVRVLGLDRLSFHAQARVARAVAEMPTSLDLHEGVARAQVPPRSGHPGQENCDVRDEGIGTVFGLDGLDLAALSDLQWRVAERTGQILIAADKNEFSYLLYEEPRYLEDFGVEPDAGERLVSKYGMREAALHALVQTEAFFLFGENIYELLDPELKQALADAVHEALITDPTAPTESVDGWVQSSAPPAE